MFELQKQKAKLVKMLPKIGKRKGDKEPEGVASLAFEATMSNDFLSELDPALKSMFYVKDESNEDLVDKTALTKLRVGPKLRKFKWEETIEGAHVEISYGISGDVVIETAKIHEPIIELHEGGSISVSFALSGQTTGSAVGKTFDHLLGNEVGITIGKPQSNQVELDV